MRHPGMQKSAAAAAVAGALLATPGVLYAQGMFGNLLQSIGNMQQMQQQKQQAQQAANPPLRPPRKASRRRPSTRT